MQNAPLAVLTPPVASASWVLNRYKMLFWLPWWGLIQFLNKIEAKKNQRLLIHTLLKFDAKCFLAASPLPVVVSAPMFIPN